MTKEQIENRLEEIREEIGEIDVILEEDSTKFGLLGK